jgi:hypothetical protein
MTAPISRTKAVTLALCVLLTIIGLLALRGGVAPVGTSKSLFIPSGYVDSWEDGITFAKIAIKNKRSLHVVAFGLVNMDSIKRYRGTYGLPVVPFGCVVGSHGTDFWTGYNHVVVKWLGVEYSTRSAQS